MLDALGNVGDPLGGAGVVVTLIYLAIQLRRNTEQLRRNEEFVRDVNALLEEASPAA